MPSMRLMTFISSVSERNIKDIITTDGLSEKWIFFYASLYCTRGMMSPA